MITVTQTRDKDGEHIIQQDLTFNDPLEAVVHLAKVELGYGGQIVGIGENRIVVQTQVMHCLDTSIFEGSSEEMKPLFELVYFYLEASRKHDDIIVEKAVDFTQCLPNRIGGVPLFFMMMAPLLVGGNRLKVAVMLACGVQDENDIRAGLGTRIEDLVAAFQLSKDGLCSFREALAV